MRRLPQQEQRVETGPVQFGDDWPGIFIRGDNAGYYAMILKTLIEGGYSAQEDAIAQIQLRGLQEVLAGAVVGPAAALVTMPHNVELTGQGGA